MLPPRNIGRRAFRQLFAYYRRLTVEKSGNPGSGTEVRLLEVVLSAAETKHARRRRRRRQQLLVIRSAVDVTGTN